MSMTAIGGGLVVLVLLRAIVHKLYDLAGFAAVVAEYRIIPTSGAMAAAVGLAGAEVAAVLLLITPTTHSIGALVAAALFGIYAVAIGVNLLRGRTQIDCGCGGRGQGISLALVLRNGLLVAICTSVAIAGSPVGLTVGDGVVVAAGLAIVWLLFVAADQIFSNTAHANAADLSRLNAGPWK